MKNLHNLTKLSGYLRHCILILLQPCFVRMHIAHLSSTITLIKLAVYLYTPAKRAQQFCHAVQIANH